MARARSWDELMDLMEVMFASEEETYRSFVPRPDDIVISPFAKCGTTWMQQLTHQLRTGGHTDFEDIYEVVPFIDVATDLGIDLDADQVASPRLFKAHATWDEVPKGCRYIVPIRDPRDAAVSFYRFMSGWLLEPGAMTVDEVHEHRSPGPEGRYWQHLASWLRRREDPDVLLLTFEGMKRDLRRAALRVARFAGFPPEHVDRAVELASFEWMSAHQGPFSEPLLRRMMEVEAGVPAASDASKVRTGAVGDGAVLSPESLERFDRIWEQTIGAEFGYADYAALEADIDGGPTG